MQSVKEHLISALISKIGENRVLTGSAVKERYHHVWLMDQPLKALAVVLPRTTQEVSDVLSICHEYHQPVVMHGGLTNLVGGTETQPSDLVISLEKMNAIELIFGVKAP